LDLGFVYEICEVSGSFKVEPTSLEIVGDLGAADLAANFLSTQPLLSPTELAGIDIVYGKESVSAIFAIQFCPQATSANAVTGSVE